MKKLKKLILNCNVTSAKCVSLGIWSVYHFRTFLVSENSEKTVWFFPLILIPNHSFPRAESLWSLSLDAMISIGVTDSPVS